VGRVNLSMRCVCGWDVQPWCSSIKLAVAGVMLVQLPVLCSRKHFLAMLPVRICQVSVTVAVAVAVAVTVIGTAKPCNRQGSQRLMGEPEQTITRVQHHHSLS
jgi:hypothetical protein